MAAAPIGTVWEARLAAVACREDAVSVESLRADGWTVASDRNEWGSVWMTRPAEACEAATEETSRG